MFTEEPPVCCYCGITMKTLGVLPAMNHRPRMRVFKCTSCGHIKVIED